MSELSHTLWISQSCFLSAYDKSKRYIPKYFQIAVLFLFFTVPFKPAFSQVIAPTDLRKQSTDTVVYPNIRIKNDVFILNACDPNQISLRRRYDDDSIYYKKYADTRKMSINSNRLSSFKIDGINPLRYKYYINSEAVTQFMETNIETLKLHNFIRDGFFLSPLDIDIPKIFATDLERNKVRDGLASFQQKITVFKDSIEFWDIEEGKYSSLLPFQEFDDEKGQWKQLTKEQLKLRSELNEQIKQAYLRKQVWESKLLKHLKEYERQLISLPISSGEISFLNDYKNKPDSLLSKNSEVKDIEKKIARFADRYDMINEDFREINRLLNSLEHSSPYYRNQAYYNSFRTNRDSVKSDSIKQLASKKNELARLLNKYSYTLKVNPDEFNVPEIKSASAAVAIKEFLMAKRYQVFEEFILETATNIGVLLQRNFRVLSQKTNSLRMQNCLTEKNVEEVKKLREEINQIFDFVQKTSAEFQILSSYLDVDNKTYTNIATSVYTNYWSLLVYMKQLDFIETNNTVEYTLPTSSNFRNVDLVRYVIDREDKITGGKQSYTYDFWLKGGLKVDFSFGIFATGLVDNGYQKVQQPKGAGQTQDVLIINKQNTGDFNFGFGGMVNVIPRMGASWVTPGVSFGAVYSTNQKLQLLSGLSLHLGKMERIVLHAGVATGFIKTIDKSQHQIQVLQKNHVYQVTGNDLSQYSVPMIEKFTAKPFFGLTYNLSKKSALQGVTSPVRKSETEPPAVPAATPN